MHQAHCIRSAERPFDTLNPPPPLPLFPMQIAIVAKTNYQTPFNMHTTHSNDTLEFTVYRMAFAVVADTDADADACA